MKRKRVGQMNTKGMTRCRRCGDQKILANERIRTTKLCYMCANKMVPSHIPKEQWITYILKYYETKM